MKILHITDFHYSKESQLQIKVVKSIVNTLKEQELNIDFVFFTGDLVLNGSKVESFENASIALFEEISTKLNITKENIIFCPGNHDIDRTVIHSAAKAYFEANITSDEKLNSLYKDKTDLMFIDSIKPSANFNNYLMKYHSKNEFNIYEDLYSIHFRESNNKKIGIVCLNSAWVSAIDKTGKNDKGNLLIPFVALKDIKKHLGHSLDKKILLIHHPLYFLKDFNLYSIENFIHNEFDLMFSGHVHKISSISRHSGTNGIFEHVAKASLSSKESLGCTIIDLDDVEENKIKVKELTYIDDDEKCHIGQEVVHTIPCGIEKTKMIAFRKKIFDKIGIEKENANHLLLLKEDEDKKDFLSLYNHPVLKKESEDGLSTSVSTMISFEELISNTENYTILGKDKCGKTSLLKRIQLEYLINYSRNGRIPFFFDAKEFEQKLDSSFDLELHIRNYFEINKEKVKEILTSGLFVLLIDNYSPNSGVAEYLNDFLHDNPTIKYIICSEHNISRSVDFFQLGDTLCEKLFFHDLRRQEIITYTEKRLSSSQNREAIQEKIIQLCKQLELPLNYWTVSLLLLIQHKSSDTYSKNLFSILDVCVDEIFGKKQLLIARSRISFEQLKAICSALAKHLFLNYENTVYSASSRDILSLIEKIVADNDRISIGSKEIFNFFVSCGILKLKDEVDIYVFRLNGFFEYFLAYQMTKDSEFKNMILEDEGKYLGFKNQLEIYSGFRRDDLDFLLAVYKKTKNKLLPVFELYNTNKDIELLNKIQEPKIIEEMCRKVSIEKSLTTYEKAELEDFADELQINADVHLIKKINPEEINSELLERYISILARVFRNSDEILGNKEKKIEIFNQIIDFYCDLGFYIIDEFSDLTKQELKKEEYSIDDFPELNLLKFISNFSPMITQVWLFDGLGHYNIERMIKNEITELEKNIGINQYRLFILYFLLLDIDLNTNKEYIQIAMNNIKIPILKYMIVVKLNYYLAFKANSNKNMQQELSNKIQQAKLNLDDKTDISTLQKQIQERKRLSSTNKNRI